MASKAEVEKLKKMILDMKSKLKLIQEAFLNIVNKSKDGILIIDTAGIVSYANPAALKLFDKGMGDLLGENIGTFINPDITTEITVIHKKRGLVNIETTITDTVWNNKPAKLASLHDVTEHKKLEQLLKHLIHYDYLTDLTNRNYFEIKLEEYLKQACTSYQKFALLYLDLDGFKKVNDTFGHQTGDQLLIKIAELLRKSMRSKDTVSRLGGDEFGIILDQIAHKSDIKKIAKKLLKLVSKPIKVNNQLLNINFSIGIAVYPDNGSSSRDLLRKSDKAMYLAKNIGPGNYQFYAE